MQIIVHTAYRPVINEYVRISGINGEYIIDTIENETPYNSVLIKSVNNNLLSRLIIINGKWQVEGYNTAHDITFNKFSKHLTTLTTRGFIDDPNQVKVGDVGTYTKGGRVGREYWDGFDVIEVIKPGKSVRVLFDRPISIGNEDFIQIPDTEENRFRILEYRRPGRWMFKGVTAKNTSGSIRMGIKKIGGEEGMF